MKRIIPVALAAVVAAAWLLGARGGEAPRTEPAAARPVRPIPQETPPPPAETLSEPAPPAPPPIDARSRLAKFKDEDVGAMEEEFEARVIEDPAFAERLFEAFLAETDPQKMSFLQNVIASHPPLRNSEEWQGRFMTVAEGDPRRERRAAAMTFLQQAETIRPVHDRMLALAETDRELMPHALVALKGLPDRRLPDSRLAELAGRIADRETDPDLRGLAIRIEADPERAARALADPERVVRMHAAHVATSRPALEKAFLEEEDDEVRAVFEARLATLK